jgi:aarF domain-containing kinase
MAKNRTLSLMRTVASTAARMGLDSLKGSGKSAPARLVKGLDDLKGAAMKFGQMASLLDEELLPEGWKEHLSKLQSQSSARPFAEILPILDLSLPQWRTQIERIDETAVHAASIGQVHTAWLRNGQKIALKVRYPGLENWVDSDLKTLKQLLKLAGTLPKSGNYEDLFARIKALFLRELNFEAEAQEYRFYAQHFASWTDVEVPTVVDSLVSHNTLATHWKEGTNLQKWIINSQATPQLWKASETERNSLSTTLLNILLEEILVLGKIQSDPNPANFLVTSEGKIAMLDFGATDLLPPWVKQAYLDLTVASLFGTKKDMIAICEQIGFLLPTDPDKARDAFVAMLSLAAEPFVHGNYTFKKGEIMKRVREHAFAFVTSVNFRSPPPDIVFLNRRIAGTQMLLEQLEGTLGARALLLKHLPGKT